MLHDGDSDIFSGSASWVTDGWPAAEPLNHQSPAGSASAWNIESSVFEY